MQANLQRRALILGVIMILLVLLVIYLQFSLIGDPLSASSYDLTATGIKEQNATVEVFIQQTQAAMTQTPIS